MSKGYGAERKGRIFVKRKRSWLWSLSKVESLPEDNAFRLSGVVPGIYTLIKFGSLQNLQVEISTLQNQYVLSLVSLDCVLTTERGAPRMDMMLLLMKKAVLFGYNRLISEIKKGQSGCWIEFVHVHGRCVISALWIVPENGGCKECWDVRKEGPP